jgi:ABC transport system ATP-binding/permease protein
MLASRHHATLVPTAAGTEIHDAHSINGTFVNGAPVDHALLHGGDVVTIGNIDLVFAGGTLIRRTETEAATSTGGLGVYGVTWTIDGNKTLLDNISFAARPGTLTAVIGPSGAGTTVSTTGSRSSNARLAPPQSQPHEPARSFSTGINHVWNDR